MMNQNVEQVKLFYGATNSPKFGMKVIDAVPFFQGKRVVISVTNRKANEQKGVQAFAYVDICDLKMLYRDVVHRRMSEKVYPVGNSSKEKGKFISLGGGLSKALGKLQSRIFSVKCDYSRNNPFTIKIQNGVGVKGTDASGSKNGLITMAHLMTDCEFYMTEDLFLEMLDNCIRAYERYLLIVELKAYLQNPLEVGASSDVEELSDRRVIEEKEESATCENEADEINVNTNIDPYETFKLSL